jgi:phosphate:Na+ symporter
MAIALKAAAGDALKGLLVRLTTNRVKAVVTGTIFTAIVQSSSVTTVLLVGFITAGLMTFQQSLGVILGADIGTTITAQIVAFKVTDAALWMVALGFLVYFVSPKERLRQYGSFVLGLGLIFFGMQLMGGATRDLKSNPGFLQLMTAFRNPLLGVLAGLIFTAAIQASAATIGVIIVLAAQGAITLEAGVALTLGANIGTATTALLAAIGKPREAKRAAFSHVLYKIFGVCLWFGFIHHLARLVHELSPTDMGRQIANAHTIFNVVNTCIFLTFTPQMARFMTWLFPDRVAIVEKVVTPRYLVEELLDTPSVGLDRARMETRRLCERIQKMLDRILPVILKGREEDFGELRRLNNEVEILYHALVQYLGKLSLRKLTEQQTRDLVVLMAGINHIENVGDLISSNMVDLAKRRMSQCAEITLEMQAKLEEYHGWVVKGTQLSHKALTEQDVLSAKAVIAMKEDFNEMADATVLEEARAIAGKDPNLIHAYSTLIETLDKFKRIFYYARRTAKRIAPKEKA